MFVFVVGPERKRILYTGDFRFHPSYRSNKILTQSTINKIYFDDTFAEDHIDKHYPTYTQTFEVILRNIKTIRETTGDSNFPIKIHASILGLESILRRLGDTMNETFQISDRMLKERADQLKYLIPEYLSENSTLVLSDRKRDLQNNSAVYWIIPTSTYFLCPENTRPQVSKNQIIVWFSTHPCKHEIYRFISICGVQYENTNTCNFSVFPLSCRNKKKQNQ
jgi:hypothetical protein